MTVDSDTFDVIIVGGGPAGVVCAITAARENLRVALFDRKTLDEIGNKVCGDALDLEPTTFLHEHLSISYPSEVSVSDDIKTLIAATEIGEHELRLDAPGYLVDRLSYGQELLKIAIEDGTVVFPEHRIVEPIIENDTCVGIRWSNKKREKGSTFAKIIVDASGTVATVRTKLPESFEPTLAKSHDMRFMAVTYREIIEFIDQTEDHDWRNQILLYFAPELPITGYYWIFSKGSYRLNLGIGWRIQDAQNSGVENLSVKDEYEKITSQFYERAQYNVLASGGGRIPVNPPLDNAVAAGFIAVGDAACQVNPMTAEGHGPALMAGYYAAMNASQAIKKGDVSRDSLWQYNKDVMDCFGAKHGVSFVIAELLRTLKYEGFSELIRKDIITSEDLLNLSQESTENAFKRRVMVKKLFKGMGNIKQLRTLYRAIKLSEKVKAHYLKFPTDPDEYQEWVDERNKLLPSLNGIDT